jgi:uncharacterized protein
MIEQKIPFTAYSFQQFLNDEHLMASICKKCQEVYLPVRAICPKCGQSDLEWIELSGKGKLAAFTSVYIGPSFMNELGFGRDKPYLVGIVELEEGPRISARLLGLNPLDPASVKIGASLVFAPNMIGKGEHVRNQLAFQLDE